MTRLQAQAENAVVIQKARPRDQGEIFRLIAEQRRADAGQASRTYRDYFTRQKRPRDQVLVARTQGKIIGVSGYWHDDYSDSGIYWLGWTYVPPGFQGRGIGQKLLDRVIQELKKRKARKLYADTSSRPLYRRALRFYRANGFKREGRFKDYYQKGEDQMVMGKEIGK